MAMMSDVEMPLAAMRSQIGSGVQLGEREASVAELEGDGRGSPGRLGLDELMHTAVRPFARAGPVEVDDAGRRPQRALLRRGARVLVRVRRRLHADR